MIAVGCRTSPVSDSSLSPCSSARLAVVVEEAPGTVVPPVPGTVDTVPPEATVVVVAPATGGCVPSGLPPSPEPRRKKNVIRKMATSAMISARNLDCAEGGVSRCRALTAGESTERPAGRYAFSPRKISETDESMKMAWSVSARIGAIDRT